jgi:hypothetical protein
MKITKKHLHAVQDEARKMFVELPGPVYLQGEPLKDKNLSESERLVYCYLQGCISMLASNKLLVDGWESKIELNVEMESSEPGVED